MKSNITQFSESRKARILCRLTGIYFETMTDNKASFMAGLLWEWEDVRKEHFAVNSKIISHIQSLKDDDPDQLQSEEAIGQQV